MNKLNKIKLGKWFLKIYVLNIYALNSTKNFQKLGKSILEFIHMLPRIWSRENNFSRLKERPTVYKI